MRKRERDRTFVRKRDYKWEREATSYETRDERYEIRERERERNSEDKIRWGREYWEKVIED